MVVSNFYKCCAAEQQQSFGIKWLTNYEAAVAESKSTGKPIILFFTGSDWCGWCSKLEEDVLNTHDFLESAGSKFIFVKLDFPLYTSLDNRLTSQNKELQKRYDIRSFPTIIVLDPQNQQQMGMTGYRPGGGKQYAQHLFKIVSDFSSYKDKMQNVEKNKFSGADLRRLYEKAKELKFEDDAIHVMRIGMQSEERSFFLTERYRFLAYEGKIHNEEATALRHQLLAEDPRNEKMIHYQLAVIEFETYSDEMDKENYSPELAVAPLVHYIEKFGNQDKANLWRLEIIVSQVFLDKNKLGQALKYAQSSYDAAPPTVQPEIATAIRNIQTQLR
jgi:protein disulfide-isomerase